MNNTTKDDKSIGSKIKSALGALLKPFHVPDIDEERLSKLSGFEEAEIRRVDFCARASRRAASIISIAFVLAVTGPGIPDDFEGWTILTCLTLSAAIAIAALAVSRRRLTEQGRNLINDEIKPPDDNHGGSD